MNRMQEKYNNEIVPALRKAFDLTNIMQVPRITKVVVNIGMGEAMDNPKSMEAAVSDLTIITGQKPVMTKARKSIANFKLREGQPIGCRVTLRKDAMYEFFDRLVATALPRIRDFRGLSPRKFDGRGNYTFGISDQTIFPEIELDKIKRTQGMDVTIVTSAENDGEALELLKMMGFPLAEAKAAEAKHEAKPVAEVAAASA